MARVKASAMGNAAKETSGLIERQSNVKIAETARFILQVKVRFFIK